MYFTLKIRIKFTKGQKEKLLSYEQIYNQQLKNLVKHMECTHNYIFSKMIFDDTIPFDCRWQLYRIALKQYLAKKDNKQSEYNRSSCWASKSIQYGSEVLSLGMQHDTLNLTLVISPHEEDLIYKNKIIRLDVVHDELYWFANFILHTKD